MCGSVCVIILVNLVFQDGLFVDARIGKPFFGHFTKHNNVTINGFTGFLNVLLIVSDCGLIDEVVARQDPRALAPWTAALYFQSTQCDFRPAGNGHGVIIGPTTVLISQ